MVFYLEPELKLSSHGSSASFCGGRHKVTFKAAAPKAVDLMVGVQYSQKAQRRG